MEVSQVLLPAIDTPQLPSTLHFLATVFMATIVVWWLQFHWQRRRLYQLAANIPGPIPWPIIGSSYKFMGDASFIYENVMQIFKDYPDIFKVWHGCGLVCGTSKPEYLEILLNSPKSLHKMYLYKYAEPMVGLGLFTSPVPLWRRHRRLIQPTFNQKILDSFVAVFAEQGEIMVDNLTKLAGKGEFDLFHHMAKCTLDIICETAMGVKVNAQTTKSEFNQWVDRLLEIAFLRMFVVSYHFDFIFKWTQLCKDQTELLTKFQTFIGRIVREKREAYQQSLTKTTPTPAPSSTPAKKRKAFLDLLIEISFSNSCANHLTDDELRDEVNTFMIAGSDTTASSSSFLFCLLGMNPPVQAKIHAEIMDVIGPLRPLAPDDLPHLHYTERVVKEALRLFPVGAFIVRDVYEDVELEPGLVIPAGSSAILGIMPVHRSEKWWPDPLKFDPDRFLPEEVAKRHPYAYLPFSRGPRNCVGLVYGMMAMKAMVAMMVRRFRFATSYKSVEDVKLKTNLVVRPVDGFKVSLEMR